MSTKLNAEERPAMTHELKCHPEPFRAVKDGSKPFEWRKYDRDFRVGDYIWLREWKPEYNLKERRTGLYSGDGLTRTITYIIREGFGIPEGYCIMGLSQPIADERDELRDALEKIASRSSDVEPEDPGYTGNSDDSRYYGAELSDWACGNIARAVLAKYPKP